MKESSLTEKADFLQLRTRVSAEPLMTDIAKNFLKLFQHKGYPHANNDQFYSVLAKIGHSEYFAGNI